MVCDANKLKVRSDYINDICKHNGCVRNVAIMLCEVPCFQIVDLVHNSQTSALLSRYSHEGLQTVGVVL